jgi:acyl-CoA reductase-like NAD-dependent aldehyde dehydrogenase
MERYRVRAGQQLAHLGKTLRGGDVVELERHVALEVQHLVDPVDATGKVKPWPSDAASALAADLARARPHERISLLRAARDAGQAHVDDIDREIANEETRLAAEDAQRAAGDAATVGKSKK